MSSSPSDPQDLPEESLDTRSSRAKFLAATCLGVGLLPGLPGTFASLVGMAVALLTAAEPLWQWSILGVAVVLSFWSIPSVIKSTDNQDPQQVVIDEFCGIMLTFAGLPMTPAAIIAGFVAFRLFDITKPLFVRRLEQLPGALGVLLDDLAAGFLARLVVLLALWIF